MKYAFIAQYKKTWPITVMCRVLGVWRDGYYRYLKRIKQPDPNHQTLLSLVREIAVSSGYSYGSRRMSRALKVLWPGSSPSSDEAS